MDRNSFVLKDENVNVYLHFITLSIAIQDEQKVSLGCLVPLLLLMIRVGGSCQRCTRASDAPGSEVYIKGVVSYSNAPRTESIASRLSPLRFMKIPFGNVYC